MRPASLATALGCLGLLSVPLHGRAEAPLEVTIPAGPYQLHACATLPPGSGPYPVVIFNHGSEKNPAPCGPSDLVAFYQERGFAFFTVQRHGHGASSGPYILDLQRQAFLDHPLNGTAARAEVVRLHELYNQDVLAAVAWLKTQSWADGGRLVMTGISFGGIQTILTAEHGLGIRAFLPFAPGAQSWNPVLADRLTRAMRAAQAPMFLLQAKNDYSLDPSRVLGPELARKGVPNQAKVYPAFGHSAEDGHWMFAARHDGIALWATDVSAFLDRSLR